MIFLILNAVMEPSRALRENKKQDVAWQLHRLFDRPTLCLLAISWCEDTVVTLLSERRIVYSGNGSLDQTRESHRLSLPNLGVRFLLEEIYLRS